MMSAAGKPAQIPWKEARRIRLAGTMLVAGMLALWVGALAFMPVLGDAYRSPDFLQRMGTIAAHRSAWLGQNMLFLAGTWATVAGLSLLVGPLHRRGMGRPARLGRAAMVAASVLWAFIIYFMLAIPAEDMHGAAELPPVYHAIDSWIWRLASALTLGSFIAYGVALLGSALPRWIGVSTVAASTAMLAGAMVVGDAMPPLLFFLVPFAIGAALLWRARRITRSRAPLPAT